METPDVEEIIPPTPEIQLNKFCSRVDKTLSKKSNLSRKALKLDNHNFKRKRILSPDHKQKVKQTTLYNFLARSNKADIISNSLTPCCSNVKVNLINKFKNTEHINSNLVQVSDVTKKISTSETTERSQMNRDENEICNNVALLQLSCKNKDSACIALDSTEKLNTCNFEVDNAKNNLNLHLEENFRDIDQSISWMTDLDWEKDRENIDLNYDSSQDGIKNNSFISLKIREEKYFKFKVKEVQKNTSNNEVKLSLVAYHDSSIFRTCLLKGFWTDTIIDVGDTIHILKSSFTDPTVIDNDTGFLVTNPDFLISSTAIVSTLFCMRKAVLNHILPQWSSGNNIMMIGSLIHDIFQKSVNSHANTYEEILKIVKVVLRKRENLISLCCQDLEENEIEEKICKYIPNILEWIRKHCSFGGKNSFDNISIMKIEDIEENVWCPKYGIKGKIDMTVKVQSQNKMTSEHMPLELKTGHPTFSAEHVGQVNLYSLMMEERSKQVSDGLLLYLRDKVEMKVIAANHHSKRGLIQLRNELASYIYKWVSTNNSNYEEIEQCHLPKPINNKRLCEKCPYLLPCTVYQKAFSEEKVLNTSHAMNALIQSSTDHLFSSHVEYFYHWSHLLLLENTTSTEIKAFWIEDSISREKKGMCLSFVVQSKDIAARHDASTEYFIHTFTRLTDNPVSHNFNNSCLIEGDYVAISKQDNLNEVAVAMGYITRVCEQYIELAIERNLGALPRLKDFIFRIDKIVSNSAASCVRNNLMLLMQNDSQAGKLRRFIVDKETPSFLQALPKKIALIGRPILKSLNKNQQKAVLKAIMAEDYFLIKGMPGTGKTSTIVALVKLLVQMKISVLLASYTHSAIDNILLKLKEHVEFVRIGPKYRIHSDVSKYSFENLTQDFTSVDQYFAFMKEKMVVATTCLGVNHVIFKVRKFDVCIIDEASQINQIACLGPLYFAKKFILVGDDKQLPPLVLSVEARHKGMQESLFERLQNISNCIELTLQYRMNREIMRLCNELTYNGSLQCGSEEVANAILHMHGNPNISDKKFPSWLTFAFHPDISKSVMFLDTDKYKRDETEKGKNDIEADLVILLLQFLNQGNVHMSDVGVIAPYRKQVHLIVRKLKDLKMSEIEVNTVDQYQGRDKNVIIISCVRSSDSLPKPDKVGIILDDEKRLNVAITRAKTKLILLGNRSILNCYKPFKDLITTLRSDQFLNVI